MANLRGASFSAYLMPFELIRAQPVLWRHPRNRILDLQSSFAAVRSISAWLGFALVNMAVAEQVKRFQVV